MFSKKIKQLRLKSGLTQSELAAKLQMTARTLQNYEMGSCYPRKSETIQKIADFFNVSVNELIGNDDVYICESSDADDIIKRLGGLFAGGSLSDSDKEKVMLAVNELYVRSIEKNRERSDEEQNNK